MQPCGKPVALGELDVGGADNLSEQDDGPDETADDDFALEAPADSRPTKTRRPRAAKAGGQVELTHYIHPEKRKNNPEVGIVNAAVDPDQPSQHWAYDPHIDPALQFDSQRSAIESLIDDALASGDTDVMRDALAELKRLQSPYLNWAGKAERTSFDVDTVSLHVHERIDPATILAGVRKQISAGAGGVNEGAQPWLFDPPFEALPLRQALDFYGHEKGWANRLVVGDSLLVMNSLLQKEGMAGQIQMIYFDPPYGIKYGSNFQPFTNRQEVKDVDADLTQEPEMIKAFRDTWELGIHSYLTYIRDRAFLAKELLKEEGSVFLQISDKNIHLIRNIFDEVFGSDNFVSIISYSTTGGFSSSSLSRTGDYIIWYCKNKSKIQFNNLYTAKEVADAVKDDYDQLETPSGRRRALTAEEKRDPAKIPADSLLYTDGDATSQGAGAATDYFEMQGMRFHPGDRNHWKAPLPQGMRRAARANRLIVTPNGKLRYLRYFSDFDQNTVTNSWFDIAGAVQDRWDPKVYVVQTNNKIVERCILMTTKPGDLVFDPTCGSGTSAVAAEKWGRRWITCDTSRVAVTLAKQRLMTASFEYYSIRYPAEGLRAGFKYKVATRVTLGTISNNEQIDAIHESYSQAIEVALELLNDSLKGTGDFIVQAGIRRGEKVPLSTGKLQEWEVPFEFPEEWPAPSRSPFAAFQRTRLERQKAINESIAARSTTESVTLVDKPDVDAAKLRVTGPFTVEAVPTPIVATLDRDPPAADATISRSGETARQADWRGELLTTGIRGKGGQMLRIAGLDVVPGCRHLHASGNLADDGARVVVSFGPEHAALEQRQVERALEEAQSLIPTPKLVVFCAFTFDPEAAKDIDEAKWPGVTLLKAQMNTDLLTEDLKKARTSNQSFWLMGQPDIDARKVDGRWQVQVNGFDYFDTKSGELVSGGKKNIAMWSLDTDYDGRAVFPRQTFFPMAGAKDGWNRLKANIKAELDANLLDQFHGTISLPFDAGEHRRIAVKIVDDRGIESLKIVTLDD
jgi:adenine-specific DNA-methyltransferase